PFVRSHFQECTKIRCSSAAGGAPHFLTPHRGATWPERDALCRAPPAGGRSERGCADSGQQSPPLEQVNNRSQSNTSATSPLNRHVAREHRLAEVQEWCQRSRPTRHRGCKYHMGLGRAL